LHEFFGVSNANGLTTMMVDDHALKSPPIQDTPVQGLHLLASGSLPPRPSDLLGSKRMERIIERLLDEADVLLFDAPPIMAATDAVILATKVAGLLLVISAGKTKREHAQLAIERLNKVKANIVGTVLNNAPLDVTLHSYYK